MKKIIKKRSIPSQTKAQSIKNSTAAAFYPLVIIDNAPIREKYIQVFKKISRELEKARSDWAVYEQEDQPAFTKWLNSTFGRELTALREIEDKVMEMEELLNDIEDCKYMNRFSYYKAYEYVMKRRANPEEFPDEDSDDDFNNDKQHNGFSSNHNDDYNKEYIPNEEEFRELFTMFLMDTDPVLLKKLKGNRLLFEELLQAFKQEFFNAGSDRFSQKKEKSRSQAENKTDKNNTDTRLRDLYRMLVRKLHPDCRKEKNDKYDAIWHEVQTAYRDRNFERLEMLAALYDIHSGNFYETSSISQIIQIQQEYKSQLKALKAQIRWVKDNPAWEFSKKNNREQLGKRIKKDLAAATGHLKNQLNDMEYVLSQWAVPPKKRNPKVQIKPKTIKKTPVIIPDDDEMQMEIPF